MSIKEPIKSKICEWLTFGFVNIPVIGTEYDSRETRQALSQF